DRIDSASVNAQHVRNYMQNTERTWMVDAVRQTWVGIQKQFDRQHDILKWPMLQIKQYADGGRTDQKSPFSIVGERGVELYQFQEPGRVYNDSQLARALMALGDITDNKRSEKILEKILRLLADKARKDGDRDDKFKQLATNVSRIESKISRAVQ
ncbi:hypothetical protein, partial [Desulfovibrio inopinatus]|uniref:hypothetical protein n=1 Tax=Desulfovibrio inopinatus TaxID=102109 RepID=UPI001B7FE9D1